MQPSQNLLLPPRIYPPPPFQQIYVILPESTPPSQKILAFSTTRLIMRRSQKLSLPARIYPPFQQLYATLQESTPPSQNISQFWE